MNPVRNISLIMKIIYLANARIPTEKAHGLQIMKMCEAFSLLKTENRKSKIEVGLIAPRRFNKIKQSPFKYYDVQPIFKITKLPCLDLTFFGFGRAGFFIQIFTFLIS